MEGINSGAVSNQVRDVQNAEVMFLIGANPTVNHPVAATCPETNYLKCLICRVD